MRTLLSQWCPDRKAPLHTTHSSITLSDVPPLVLGGGGGGGSLGPSSGLGEWDICGDVLGGREGERLSQTRIMSHGVLGYHRRSGTGGPCPLSSGLGGSSAVGVAIVGGRIVR